MSVNHFLLPISDDELSSLRADPDSCKKFVQSRRNDVRSLSEFADAITALIGENEMDELAFLSVGGPESECGWIGEYVEQDGNVVTCQVDMGYGPASFYKNSFVKRISKRIGRVSVSDFQSLYDADWLADNEVNPSGWHDDGRAAIVFDHYNTLRDCVRAASQSRQHLLVWCA